MQARTEDAWSQTVDLSVARKGGTRFMKSLKT